MTIEYNPQEVTDWLTPLEKVYARQSEQLERYHQQLRERDRQEVEARIDIPEVLGKLAQFSQTITQIAEAGKEKRRSTYISDYANIPRSGEDRKLEATAYRLIKNDILKEDVRFQDVLKNMSPDLREAISNASAAQEVWGAEYNIKEKLKYLNKDKWKASYAPGEWEVIDKESLIKQDDRYREWINLEISDFNISKGLRASAIDAQIEKLISTNSTTSKVRQKARFTGTEQLKFAQGLVTDIGAEDYNSIVSRVQHRIQIIAGRNQTYTGKPGGLIELDQTEIQKATVEVFNELKDLAFNQELTVDQIEKIINLEGVTDHPAGKTLKKAFLNKAGENALVQAARDGAAFKLNQIRAEAKQGLTQVLAKGYAGEYASQAEFDAAALEYKSLVSTEDWKMAEKFNFVSQSKAVYEKEATHFEQTIVDGTFLTKSNIDRAKDNENTTIVSEITKKQNAIIESQKTNKFPNFETRNKSNDSIVMQDSKNRTLGDGEVLGAHTWKGQLSTEMTKQEAIIYMKYYNENPDDTNITARVAADMAALKKEKGFGIPIGEPGAGEWSKDESGNYPNFVRSKVGELSIIDNESTWEQNFITTWDQLEPVPGVSIIDTFLNTPGAIISPKEIIDIVTSDDPQLSAKFIYKIGKIPNKPKGKALIQITEALIQNPQYKDLVEQSDLKNKLKELITPSGEKLTPLQSLIQAEEFLTELVEETANPDTIQIHKKAQKVGLENLTPKERVRLVNGINIIQDINTEQDVNKRLQRLNTLNIDVNDVPESALESDEALDKFIAQQGLLEPK